MPTPVTVTGQLGELLLVANAVTNVDINQIPGVRELGIDPNAANFHRYDVRNGICVVTNPNCTLDKVFDALVHYPAPGATGEPVYDGSQTYVPGLGAVIHYVDPTGLSVANVTTTDHTLYPGVVFRQVYQDGQIIGIQTTGVGNGILGQLNSAVGSTMWALQSDTIANYALGITNVWPPFANPISFEPGSGNVQFDLTVFSDSSKFLQEHDLSTSGAETWSERNTTIDSSDHTNKVETLNDSGTKTVTTYDPYSQHAWSSFVQDYNFSGNLVSTTQNNHDQTKVVEEFDPLSAQPWSLIHTVYAANGSRMQQSGDNDNGTHWTANWDLANSGSWSQVYREFDANWNHTYESGDNDNGTHWTADFSPARPPPPQSSAWRSTAIGCNLRFYFP